MSLDVDTSNSVSKSERDVIHVLVIYGHNELFFGGIPWAKVAAITQE